MRKQLIIFRGIAIQANNKEQLVGVTVSGSFGLYFGLGGAVSVEVFVSGARAYIGEHAEINKDRTNVDHRQAVQLVSYSDTNIFTFAGGVAGGLVGVGAAIDVGVIRTNSVAFIGQYAEIYAKGDVKVVALNNKDVFSIPISLGGGGVAIAGGVSVWVVGGVFDSSYEVDDNDVDYSDDVSEEDKFGSIKEDPLHDNGNDTKFDTSVGVTSAGTNEIKASSQSYG